MTGGDEVTNYNAVILKGGSGFDSRWHPWKTSSELILLCAFSSTGLLAVFNKNVYQGIPLE